MQNNIILKTIIMTNKTRNRVTDVTNRGWRMIFINRTGEKWNLRGTCCFRVFSSIRRVNNQNPHTTHNKIICKSFKYVCTRNSDRFSPETLSRRLRNVTERFHKIIHTKREIIFCGRAAYAKYLLTITQKNTLTT